MQESVTCLIFKKNDPKDLKNWCPISLLNVDYKLSSRALANHLSKILPLVVDEDQLHSIPSRTIFETLSFFWDTFDYLNIFNETWILSSLDQEKAFDCVDHSFLTRVPDSFGFGTTVQRWILTLYCSAIMRIIVNGNLTDRIPWSVVYDR